MRMHWLGGLLVAAVLTGCGRETPPANDDSPSATLPASPPVRLGDKVGISLAKWLTLPRADLAKLADEWTETVRKQQLYVRENPEAVELLPQLRPSLHVPVFQHAQFSPAAGFSIPPYYRPKAHDAALALHLARFGDRDAALKVADPTDKALLERLDALRVGRNYPVEWTRLVGIVLHGARLKLALGDADGATELVLLHKQLREVLDPKAAAGSLGAALLPVGRRALGLAVEAWRTPKRNHKELADEVAAALKAWGPVPRSEPELSLGASAAEVARVFGERGKGPVFVAHGPEPTERALDLIDLPVPPEGAEAVVAFLDPEDRLADLLVVYRRRVNEIYPEPSYLARRLIGQGDAGDKPTATAAVRRQTYVSNGLAYDLSVVTQGDALGGLVRVRRASAVPVAPAFSRDPRDFGAAHLDHSFEEQRSVLAPEQGGQAILLKQRKALARIAHPAGEAPATVLLQRAAGHESLAHLRLRWSPDMGPHALDKLLLPLWSAYGNARIEETEDADGGSLTLTWESADTRLRLRLPHDSNQPPELLVEDARGGTGKERSEASLRRDEAARKARFAAGKPRTRLARFMQPLVGVEIRLGMTRKEAEEAVPHVSTIQRLPAKDALNLLFLEDPPHSVRFWPRQMFVRFGPDGSVAEIRVRYQEGLKPFGGNPPTLLQTLRAKPNGAPEVVPAPWVGLWPDLPKQTPAPTQYRWRDDRTILTCQRDGGGAEVVLRDRPADKPLGVELPPLVFCPRGIDQCHLGDPRADVLKTLGVESPTKAGDAEVLPMPESSPYDVLLIWSDRGKVVRLVARRREVLKPKKIGMALQKAWGEDVEHLGYPRRQDGRHGAMLQGFSWHDDHTRVRIFAQDTDAGPRLFTEWRDWPLPK